MISISDTAQSHFRRILDNQGVGGMGIRLAAVHPGTAKADCRLEFCEPADLDGREWMLECKGFNLYVDAASTQWLDGAEIDYAQSATGGQLTIRAPHIKGHEPGADASIVERVRYVLDHDIAPQLAAHGGRVALEEIAADGVVVLRFGGGCHGCGMVETTVREGIEKTLIARVPGITAVRDATDHSCGDKPYIRR
ncbi:MAG: NfuA family Fe-S biogenesis protein [Rhodanobacteraceae bacterium]|jgi:Fe/S biogenesis protein NfuA|nr:NfuA family Fe-S biogenesis protein [Rhodanobacteraceae bacterium]MBL0041443.1 NfuA family Fe-S biogenesis protein [Xanthomonadales bacterium]MBP6078904.1 NfuA family Fe-S biogenesis protein [Xanthomonadales bacterium]